MEKAVLRGGFFIDRIFFLLYDLYKERPSDVDGLFLLFGEFAF